MLVADIIKEKDDRVVSVAPNTKISTVAHILRQEDIGAVLVTTEDKNLLGIISERDIVSGIDEHGPTITELHCSKLMTSPVSTCNTQTRTDTLMKQMLSERIRHVPVVNGGKLLGIVSIGDVVKNVVAESGLLKDVYEKQVITLEDWATEDN